MFIKLGEILKIQHGFAFKSENYLETGFYRLVTLGNFSENNSFKFNESKAIYYGEDFPKEYVLEENDLIMPLTEQVVGLFGNTALVPFSREYRFVLNQRVGRIVCNEKIVDKYYLHYLMATNSVKKQLEDRASGTKQRNISPKNVYDVCVLLPNIKLQRSIGKALQRIDVQIELNNAMANKLQVLGNAIFTQFFKDEKATTNLLNFPYISIIKPGVKKFIKRKRYLATAEVDNTAINYDAPLIEYDDREIRANMQPIYNSVWFAKMKNSIKHIFISMASDLLVNNFVFSTGFFGIKCEKIAYEYMVNYLKLPYFEVIKDKLAHGATQEAVNNEDLNSVKIQLPPKTKLEEFHYRTKTIYENISKIEKVTYRLSKIKNALLPLLINGQLS